MCVGRDRRLGGKKCVKLNTTSDQQHSTSRIECIAGPIQNDPLWSISTESDQTVRGWPGKKRDELFFHTEKV